MTPEEPLASTRARRTNAGAKMSQMIQAEEDDFYQSVYGGFNEEDDDEDFDEEQEEEDYSVDSDFDNDETDEILPEFQEEGEEKKKKSSRVYKDPKPKQSTSTSGGVPSQAPPKIHTPRAPTDSSAKPTPSRFVRESTKEKREQTLKRMETKKKKRNRIINFKPLTQEEILAEAKITEEENIRSLKLYQKSELEKLKKIKATKKNLQKPYVTYTSTSMPIVGTDERYSRNFLTFIE